MYPRKTTRNPYRYRVSVGRHGVRSLIALHRSNKIGALLLWDEMIARAMRLGELIVPAAGVQDRDAVNDLIASGLVERRAADNSYALMQVKAA
jgi:hypothetical protein